MAALDLHDANDAVSAEPCTEADKCTGTTSKDGAASCSGRQQEAQKHQSKFRTALKAFLHSLLLIDHTAVTFVPPLRTALIMIVEMFLMDIGNNRSTAFRLGALFVGLSDPSSSLSRRVVRFMGLTLVSVTAFGALMAGVTWQSPAGTMVSSFLIALLTGLSPALGSSAGLFLAMKFAMALFAINGGINRSTDGYGGLGYFVLWTFGGGFSSLLLAILPEIVGNRDAVRTDLFKVWRGFGMNLRRWGKDWGTMHHLEVQPIPTVTLSVTATKDKIYRDETETAIAKEWLLGIMESADTIRVASLCLTNSRLALGVGDDGAIDDDEETDAFFHAVGRALNGIAFALQFPWIVRYTPFLRNRTSRAVDTVDEAAAALVRRVDDDNGESANTGWLASIVELIRSEVQQVSEVVSDDQTWPPYSPPTTLPRRIRAAFPSKFTLRLKEDPIWAIRGYALRLAVAYTLAMMVVVLTRGSYASHWFPMTVAFIMVPGQAATYEKVVHRVIGTLLGLFLGVSLTPLFSFAPALIILLGLTTYATVLFFTANYAFFTFFLTGWVFVTVIGAGDSALWSTTLYRCVWTLAAGVLVMVVMLTKRPKAKDLGGMIATFAGQLLEFAKAVQCRLSLEENNENEEEVTAAAEAAKAKASEIRRKLASTRTSILATINEAALLLPISEGYSIDPLSLAPRIASDLVHATVILLSVCLVEDGSADGLLSDLDQGTFSELERLVKRLESQAQGASATSQPVAVGFTPDGTGPFSNAIACAHRTLDEGGA